LRLQGRIPDFQVTGCGGSGRRRVFRPEPDEYDLGIGVDSRKGNRTHLRERLHGVAVNLGDACYGVAGGKYSAQSGRYEQVAALDIGIPR
jgi:hypothetical protein